MGTETWEMELTTIQTICARINILERYAEDELTTDGTDEYGNAEDGINDNTDNIAPKSIPLGRYAEDRTTTDGTDWTRKRGR